MSTQAWCPARGMVLSAGFGTRMRPITDTTPKPMVQLLGRRLIDRALDRLEAVGVQQTVVNLHHLGDKIEAHLRDRNRPEIIFSREEEILETGGGVKKALKLFGEEPFFVINGDVCWLDGQQPALQRLATAWRDDTMDALLLIQPIITAVGYDGWAGDFVMDPLGRLRRRREREVAPFLFAGVQILHPRLFKSAPAGPFSLNLLYDKALEAGRLWGLRHDGEWYHIGTPENLAEVEADLHYLAGQAENR